MGHNRPHQVYPGVPQIYPVRNFEIFKTFLRGEESTFLAQLFVSCFSSPRPSMQRSVFRVGSFVGAQRVKDRKQKYYTNFG